ncbi:hypothetical protein EDD22DRAFT_964304 [Suillus occidentalis]|nr:hypothetical protein EDD22DRAFT_964304 [Suillus occidentalis]
MLNVLHGEAEDARNRLHAYRQTRSATERLGVSTRRPFLASIPSGEEKRLSVVLTTDPLVQNIPDPSRSAMPQLKRSDIGKGDSKLSPSKSNAKGADYPSGSPGGGEGSSALANRDDLLSGLPDPLGRYSGLITQYNLQDAVVVAPAVRSGNGLLIKPAEYGTKLTNGDPVMVECQLKLWNIGPNKRDNAPPEEKNGARRYQVMLKSMKLLPDASITAKTSHDFHLGGKGKRKASDPDDDSHARKRVQRDGDFEDDDPRDDVGSSGSGLHAMQTED